MNDPKLERILWGVGTSRTLRPHWALIELGLQYGSVPIRTRSPEMETPEFLAVNPRGKLPVLRDGQLILTESPAIVTYLAERYSRDGNRLIPSSIEDRARYFEWLSFISMELDATSLYVLRRHVDLKHIYGDAPAANEASRGYFDRMIGSVPARLADGRRYLLGDSFSGVDILMVSCFNMAGKFNVGLPIELDDYRERVCARPSYAMAIDANKP